MSTLCLSFRFIQPYPLFHGTGDGGEAEWPPSPIRAFQALLNSAALRSRGRMLAPDLRAALHELEVLHPHIVAPRASVSTIGHRAYVPHNHADLVSAAWHRGDIDASIASHRIEKDHRPMRIEAFGDDLPAVHYLYQFNGKNADPAEALRAILPSVRSIHCLGWGIDQVIADATLIDDEQAVGLIGERWTPTVEGGHPLRLHRKGSLAALQQRHAKFLTRLSGSNWTPVPPLNAFDRVRYRRDTDPVPRPYAVFRLLDENDDTVTYPQSKLIHIAGMVRHLAIDRMADSPPRDTRGRTSDKWVEQYVAGHRDKTAEAPHTQFSYIPLQSIGMAHTDPAVRRVMIVAPLGDEVWVKHLARHLDGQQLKQLPDTTPKLPCGTRLERIADNRKDGVRDTYLRTSRSWASVTPVILPGHDDRKPAKTRKLIQKALAQSGIDQLCEFEWSAFSQFRKMLGAHKYVRDESAKDGKRQINYVRPDHLLDRTAVHVRLSFRDPVPGPITIGSGRHCGFGLLAESG